MQGLGREDCKTKMRVVQVNIRKLLELRPEPLNEAELEELAEFLIKIGGEYA